MNIKQDKVFSVRNLTIISMMVSLTLILMFTPLGTISFPFVRISIAHIPTLISAVVLGLPAGLTVSLFMGCTSLFIALTSPVALLDPFFVNPLVSVLPRVLIPITTYFVYHGLNKLFRTKGGEYVSIAVAVIVGNLTNTFGVYTMLYIIYAKQIFEKSGKPALELIIALMSSTTLIKCIGVVVVTVPIIYALKQFNKRALNSY